MASANEPANIPFSPFRRESPALHNEMSSAFSRVLASGHWILGPEVAAFEAAWASACGTEHAVGTANGLDALEIVLRALGIGDGDEVITTPMTALATVLAIHRAGATPVLADVVRGTALLDVKSATRCLSDRTRALLPVHLYGNGSSAPLWAAFAHEHGLLLIEDCAQAHLAMVEGRPIGSFGVAGAFSFYPTKNLGAIGDAGALVTSDAALADRAMMLRNYGQRDRYVHEVAGMNSRLDELQAALLLVRLRALETQTTRRRAIATRLVSEISNPAIEHLERPNEPGVHVHHLFVVRCDDRAGLEHHLAAHGVSTLVHYPLPAHLQAPFREARRDPVGLAVSERHAATCLSLPCHPGLEEVEVDRIIEAANSFRPASTAP